MSALPAPDTNDSILDAGIDASGAAWRPAADQLPLFHGTRESYARATSQHGYTPIAVAAQVAAVALEYDVPLEALRSHQKSPCADC